MANGRRNDRKYPGVRVLAERPACGASDFHGRLASTFPLRPVNERAKGDAVILSLTGKAEACQREEAANVLALGVEIIVTDRVHDFRRPLKAGARRQLNQRNELALVLFGQEGGWQAHETNGHENHDDGKDAGKNPAPAQDTIDNRPVSIPQPIKAIIEPDGRLLKRAGCLLMVRLFQDRRAERR